MLDQFSHAVSDACWEARTWSKLTQTSLSYAAQLAARKFFSQQHNGDASTDPDDEAYGCPGTPAGSVLPLLPRQWATSPSRPSTWGTWAFIWPSGGLGWEDLGAHGKHPRYPNEALLIYNIISAKRLRREAQEFV